MKLQIKPDLRNVIFNLFFYLPQGFTVQASEG